MIATPRERVLWDGRGGGECGTCRATLHCHSWRRAIIFNACAVAVDCLPAAASGQCADTTPFSKCTNWKCELKQSVAARFQINTRICRKMKQLVKVMQCAIYVTLNNRKWLEHKHSWTRLAFLHCAAARRRDVTYISQKCNSPLSETNSLDIALPIKSSRVSTTISGKKWRRTQFQLSLAFW